jgi:hypothetical protein
MIHLVTSRSLQYRDEQILADHLRSAGIDRSKVRLASADDPPLLTASVVVAMGERAASAYVPGWQGSAMERRGYVWDSPHASIGVVSTLSPGMVDKEWVPGSPLFLRDLARAKALHDARHLRRPTRTVEIVSSPRDARAALESLRRDGRIGCDIENFEDGRIACVGFAGRADRAYVFTPAVLDECRPLLESLRVTLVFHNGFYDCYVLAREGFPVRAQVYDTMLGWHSMYPELAGSKEDGKRRRTSKALKFLASIYTLDPWWKDYEFASEEERYILNGRDCCVTKDIDAQMQPQIDAMGVRDVYERACRTVHAFTFAHLRGLKVNESLRRERIAQIEERLAGFSERLNGIVVPLLEERGDKLNGTRHLFEQIEGVCPCCRHAANKQRACWSCAGFDKAPSKADLVARGGDAKASKAELERILLAPCSRCAGLPRKEWLEFNPDSPPQKLAVMHDLLGLPKRYKDGKPTTEEAALKNLLSTVL